jgi:hypothetical protein
VWSLRHAMSKTITINDCAMRLGDFEAVLTINREQHLPLAIH